MRQPSRRDVVRLAGLAGVASVAACTGSSSAKPSRSTTPRTIPTTAPVSGTTPSSGSSTSRGDARHAAFADLARRLSGRLAMPGQADYRPGALLYNPRFADQQRPQAIAYCVSPADVVSCVRFAADRDVSLRIRNGGHSYGGWSSGPGLVVNLAKMNSVHIDHDAMTATIDAGALLADVYSKLDAKGVSIGAGSCATVGVTGLTLGGGVGLLTGLYGLTCDQLESASVVTATGALQTASKASHPDLFWALRGGGGSFAAVTSLTFRVRPAPRVRQVFLQWPGADAAAVLSEWQEWSRHTPRELWSTCKVLARPGAGVRALVLACWTGAGSPKAQVRALLKAAPRPTTNSPSDDAYGAAMLGAAGCSGSARACVTAALTPAQRLPEAAASSILQTPLPDNAVADLVGAVHSGLDVDRMVEGGVSFDALGGAVRDIPVDGTAFPWRDAIADIQYTATWPYARATDHPDRYDRFVQRERAALTSHVGQSGYANYADPSLRDYGRAYWGPNLARLTQVKRAYDPHNLFSFPQSVPL